MRFVFDHWVSDVAASVTTFDVYFAPVCKLTWRLLRKNSFEINKIGGPFCTWTDVLVTTVVTSKQRLNKILPEAPSLGLPLFYYQQFIWWFIKIIRLIIVKACRWAIQTNSITFRAEESQVEDIECHSSG